MHITRATAPRARSASTWDLVPGKGLPAVDDEGVLTLPNGELRGVLELESVNLASMTPGEQDALAASFAATCASLVPGQHLQILVESHPANASDVLPALFAQVTPPTRALAEFSALWRSWLEEQFSRAHVPDLRFYALFSPARERLVGVAALRAALGGTTREPGEERRDLEQGGRDLLALCKRMGLAPRRLRGAAVRALLARALPLETLSLRESLDAVEIHVGGEEITYAASLYVLEWPARTSPGVLADLVALDCPYRLALHITGRGRYAERVRLERKRSRLSLALRAARSSGRGLVRVEMEQARAEIDGQVEALLDPRSAIVQLGLTLTLLAPTREALRTAVARARSLFQARLGAEVATARGLQLPLWRTTLPLGVDAAGLRTRARTETAGNLLPFLSHNPGTRTGYPLGFTAAGHELALLDFAERSLPNALCNVLGKSGSGKTFLVQKFLLWTLLTGGRVTIVDRSPGHYETLRSVVGGTTARLADPAPRTINIWDRGGGDVSLERKVAFVVSAHEILLRPGGAGGLEPLVRAILEQAITDVYTVSDGTPLERDLVAWLHDAGTTLGDAAERQVCRDLALTLGPYVGAGQYAPIVDRPTGVDLDSPLIIFDLEDLDEQMYAFAIFAATEAVDRRAKRRSAREGTNPAVVREALVIDEGWFILKYAGAGAWIDELARKGRHWGLTMFFISQQVSDTTDDPHATSLLTQGSVRCLFRQQDAPSRAGAGGTGWLAAVLGLSEEEVRQVQRLGGSEEEFVEMFLWRDSKQTGPRRGIVNVPAHPLEYWLFTSEPNRDRPRRDAMIRACGGDVWAAVKALAADEEIPDLGTRRAQGVGTEARA